MLDVFTVGRKAAKYGYKKFGIPGAIVAGVGGAVGYRAAKGAAKSIIERRAAADTKTETIEPAGTTIDESTDVSVPISDSGDADENDDQREADGDSADARGDSGDSGDSGR